MNILTMQLGPLATNCYLVWKDGEARAVVIDPADNAPRILSAIQAHGLSLDTILLTHAHFDHIGALKALQAACQPRILISEDDKDDPSGMANGLLTYTDTCRDADRIEAAGLSFRVLSTPGHTPGSVCYLCDGTLFAGDTLFAGSYGRTDFRGGSDVQMLFSLKRLSQLEPQTRVLPGHGPESTIEEELQYNPGMREAMRR